MIPQIFHRIWLGGQPMPQRYVDFGAALAALHPGWELRTWTDSNLPALTNRAEFDAAPHAAARANILRYELLLNQGGVYLDADVEPLRCIEPLLAGVQCFVVRMRPDMICCAALGAAPGTALLQDLVAGIPPRIAHIPKSAGGQQTYESRMATGSFYLTRVVAQHPEVTILEPETFFPYPTTDRWANPQVPWDAAAHPDAYAVHWWDHNCVPRPQSVAQGGDA